MHPRLDLWLLEGTGIHSPLAVYAWPFMVCVAVLLAGLLSYHAMCRAVARGELPGVRIGRPTSRDDRRRSVLQLVERGMFVALLFGCLGSKLLAIFENARAVLHRPSFVLECGMTVYGGLFLGGVAVVVYFRRAGFRVLALGDIVAPGLMLAYGVGRVGCHLAGDGCWGGAADATARPMLVPEWLWAEAYRGNVAGITLASPGVHPTPLWELFACTILAVVLFALQAVPALQALLRRRPREGSLWFLYLVLAGIERFAIETVRIEARVAFGLTEAQWVAVASVLAGTVGLLVLHGWRRASAARAEAV